MPMKFKSKRGRRGGMRKNAPRRRRNIAVTRVAQRTFADKMLVKLPYVDLETYTSIGGIWYNQKGYRVNALYDPEASLGNDSALGFTQYMNIYSKYRVYRVDYDITLTNTNNQTAVAGAISFELPTGFSFSGDPSDLIVPYSKKFSLATGGSALATKRIRGSVFLPRVAGLTSEQYRTNENYYGTATSNPIDIINMNIKLINVNQGTSNFVQADVRYTAHTEFFDRNKILTTQPPVEVLDPEL